MPLQKMGQNSFTFSVMVSEETPPEIDIKALYYTKGDRKEKDYNMGGSWIPYLLIGDNEKIDPSEV